MKDNNRPLFARWPNRKVLKATLAEMSDHEVYDNVIELIQYYASHDYPDIDVLWGAGYDLGIMRKFGVDTAIAKYIENHKDLGVIHASSMVLGGYWLVSSSYHGPDSWIDVDAARLVFNFAQYFMDQKSVMHTVMLALENALAGHENDWPAIEWAEKREELSRMKTIYPPPESK